jgi:hypothetical protein
MPTITQWNDAVRWFTKNNPECVKRLNNKPRGKVTAILCGRDVYTPHKTTVADAVGNAVKYEPSGLIEHDGELTQLEVEE